MKTNCCKLPLLLLSTLVFTALHLKAQAPNWSSSLSQSNPDFYQITSAAQQYYDSTGLDTVKGSGYKSFKRWENFWKTRVGEPNNQGSFQPSFEAVAALVTSTSACNGSGIYNEKWSYIGHTQTEPTDNGNNWGRGQGIVVKVYVDSKNDNTLNTVYVGSSHGGLWKTTHAKNTTPDWKCLTDGARLPGIGVNDIAIAPSNDDTIYISTGLGQGNAATYGMGLLKSTDKGVTWKTTGLSYDLNNPSAFRFTQGVFISPVNSNIIFALSKNEIWKSTDGAANFTKVFTASNASVFFRDLVFMPSDPNTIIASAYGPLVIKSTNHGGTWSDISNLLSVHSTTSKIDLAVTDANQDLVAAAVVDNYGTHIVKSYNNGVNWSKTTINFSPAPVANGYWYNDLVISPDNEDIMYIGETQTCKSTNGGATFATLYGYGAGPAHPDVRDLEIRKDGQGNDLVYCGNDGGLSLTENSGSTWKNLNGVDLGIADIYGFGVNLKKDWIAVGCQDMGIYNYDNGTWKNICHGDGIRALFDPFNSTERMYVQNNGGGLDVSTNRGASWGSHSSPGNWENVMDMDALGNMYFAYKESLFRKSNSQTTFTLVTNFLTNFPNVKHRIWGLGISKSDPNTVYVGFDEPTWSGSTPSSRLFKTSNALNSSPTWTDISANLPCNWMGISSIVVDPANPNNIWVCTGTRFVQSGAATADRVHFSSNGGSSFNTINKDLAYASGKPMVFPINAMVLDEATGGLYIGSDIGVFYNPNPKSTTSSWVCFNKDLPLAVVTDLKIDYCQRKILASTYGRGLWESGLAESPHSDIVINTSSNLTINTGETRIFYSNITIPAGQTLTVKGLLRMASGRKITVNPGAKILIDGGRLTSTCDVAWGGIVVEGTSSQNQSNLVNQGFVEIKNNGIIENALDALHLIGINSDGSYNWNKTGGIVKATNAIFRNNRRDVAFMSYHPKNSAGTEMNNISFFTTCQFLTTADNKIPNNQLISHVTMWDVNGVRISGCVFQDQRTTTVTKSQGRGGIYTIQSNYTVNAYCSNPLQIPCTGTPSKFLNLKSAIESYSNGTRGIISIENSRFTSYKGAYLKGTTNSLIRADSFTVGHDVVIASSTDYPYGLYLDQCQGFNTEGNMFKGNTGAANVNNGGAAGLVIRNTGANNNEFYRCFFDNLKVASQALSSNKAVVPDKGLRFRCNDYDNNRDDLYILDDPKQPNTIAGQLGMAEFQGIIVGSAPKPPLNLFGNSSSILGFNIENKGGYMQYVHLDPTAVPRSKPSVITGTTVGLLQFNGTPPGCPNNLTGWATNPPVLTQQLLGLRPSVVQKSTDWKNTTDGGNTNGLKQSVQNANATNVGAVVSQLLSYSPYLSLDVLALVAGNNGPFSQAQIRDVLVANPHAARSEWIQSVLDNRINPLAANYRSDIDAVKGQFTARDALATELAYYTDEYDLTLNELLSAYLNNDTSENMGDIDTLLKHPTNPAYHYQLAEMYFDRDMLTDFNNVLNNIPSLFALSTEQAQYQAAFTDLFNQIQNWKQSPVSLMEPEAGRKQWLLNFISNNAQVPSRTYALLAANDTIPVFPDVYIPDENNNPPPARELPTITKQLQNENISSAIMVYPNPSEKNFTFEWKSKHEISNATIIISDSKGRQLIKNTWPAGTDKFILHTNSLSPGVYYAEIVSEKGEVVKRKLLLLNR